MTPVSSVCGTMRKRQEENHKHKGWASWLAALLWLVPVAGQSQPYTLLTWNVENLFDCSHDSLKNDLEFLPQSERRWTHRRYHQKLVQIARLTASVMPENGWPLLVGLQEVENPQVMDDLTRHSPLAKAGYAYVMTDSPDMRGIDVALMYRPDAFCLLSHRAVRIPSAENGLRPTRDILVVKGVVKGMDTLHVAVCHLPSRAGDTRAGTRNRMLAAAVLRAVADSLQGQRLVVMGDFNADTEDAVFTHLCPPLHDMKPRTRRSRGEGTYYFQQQWSTLDHILASDSLLPFLPQEARTVGLPFLKDKDGHPKRTFKGTIYTGGTSDHLPVAIVLNPSAD